MKNLTAPAKLDYFVFIKVETGLESFSFPIALFYNKHAAYDYAQYLNASQSDDTFVSYFVDNTHHQNIDDALKTFSEVYDNEEI